MKEILYIAPYRQRDEWGRNSKAFLNLLLQEQDIDLVIRPVWFNHDNNYYEEQNIINEYELKKIKNKDILIQYGLPNHLNYDGTFNKNIAITHIDCNANNIGWDSHLNLFDKIIVFSEFEKQILLDSKVQTEIYNFNYPPIHSLNNNIQELNLNHLKHNFIFYTSLSTDKKSGFKELLISYLSSFDTLDNVILIVLHNENNIEKEIDDVKNLLNIYGNEDYYPNVALVNNSNEEIINYLHLNANCYIDISYNSRISQNILKAIYNQRLILLLDNYKLINEYPFYVKSNDEIISYDKRPLEGLYSGEYTWKVPSTSDLRDKLKQIFNNDNELRDIAIQKIIKLRNNIIDINKFNLKEALCI